MINENIAYAKSILNKLSILPTSDEYKDYLKIREICGTNHGYVGILVKLRFIDKVVDMEEIQSIFEVLKNSKIDFAKLNRLTYDQILDTFFTELNTKTEADDIELIHRDKQYSYYLVKTYKGILNIGSPTWCLKTKSHWDSYKSKYDQQWVIIDNKYIKGLVTPNNNHFKSYSTTKPYIRYGMSTKKTGGYIEYVVNDDNNKTIKINPNSYTAFSVICTVFNLVSGIKKSSYENFPGCRQISIGGEISRYLKIVDIEKFKERAEVKFDFQDTGEYYVILRYTYDMCFICIEETSCYVYSLYDGEVKEGGAELVGNGKYIIEKYAAESHRQIFYGIKYKIGKITLDEMKQESNFVSIIDDKWCVFSSKEDDLYYLVVNLKLDTYNVNFKLSSTISYPKDNNIYFYIHKVTGKVANKFEQKSADYIMKSLGNPYKSLDKGEDVKKDDEKKGFISKFKDMFK